MHIVRVAEAKRYNDEINGYRETWKDFVNDVKKAWSEINPTFTAKQRWSGLAVAVVSLPASYIKLKLSVDSMQIPLNSKCFNFWLLN